MFILDAGGSNECPIVKIELWSSRIKSPEETGLPIWNSFIFLKDEDLFIKHNSAPYNSIENNTIFDIYINAFTYGGVKAMK